MVKKNWKIAKNGELDVEGNWFFHCKHCKTYFESKIKNKKYTQTPTNCYKCGNGNYNIMKGKMKSNKKIEVIRMENLLKRMKQLYVQCAYLTV